MLICRHIQKITKRLTYLISMSSSSNPSPPRPSGDTNRPGNPEVNALSSMMEDGISPKILLSHLAPTYRVPTDADDMMLWRLIVSMIEPPKRKKLTQFNTIGDAFELINEAKKIVVLSGAGISTSAGLPDFRSRDGIYVQIHEEHPDLRDPKYMFDIDYFRKNPLPFYQFAKALYPGQYEPTIGHKFIKCIEDHNKLLRNYSQNIDTLEKQAGIKRVVECHGSFAQATCTNCKYVVDCEDIRADIMRQKVPLCQKCHDPSTDGRPEDGLGVLKPNIVFFGEQLGENFHQSLENDKEQVDLLIVIGSSLKVRPVALIPRSIPASVPQILINKEPLDHMNFDIELLGNCDTIIQELCLRLGDQWTRICETKNMPLKELVGLSNLKLKKEPEPPKYYYTTSDFNKKTTHDSSDELIEVVEVESETGSPSVQNNDKDDETSSFKSNVANVPSESMDQNMIEESDEDIEGESSSMRDKRAMSDCNRESDDNWEDIEVLESSPDSNDGYSKEIADIEIPDSSYLFIAPNKYIFQGAELTNAHISTYTKDSERLDPSDQTTNSD